MSKETREEICLSRAKEDKGYGSGRLSESEQMETAQSKERERLR